MILHKYILIYPTFNKRKEREIQKRSCLQATTLSRPKDGRLSIMQILTGEREKSRFLSV